ncbi:MAG TPA: YkgJ family cysteine cluster protein [Pyrinomonadaceae bacterium]|nr:YkgJ family cysteine cluster protein [Pyrinomonadaceae bacterium]
MKVTSTLKIYLEAITAAVTAKRMTEAEARIAASAILTDITNHRLRMQKLSSSEKLDYALEAIRTQTEFQVSRDPNSSKISCRRGCAFCCEQQVHVTRGEAERIVDFAYANGIALDYERLRTQAEIPERSPENWTRSAHRRCVFLGDENECRIYDVRPIVCRNHRVVSEPRLCNVRGVEDVALYVIPKAEAATTAYFTDAEMNALPQMLLEVERTKSASRT